MTPAASKKESITTPVTITDRRITSLIQDTTEVQNATQNVSNFTNEIRTSSLNYTNKVDTTYTHPKTTPEIRLKKVREEI